MPRKKKSASADQATGTSPSSLTFKAQSSPLLRLPAELRNRIFDLVRSDTTARRRLASYPGNKARLFPPWMRATMFYGKRLDREPFTSTKPNTPVFAKICKQIYMEQIQIFYAHTKFSFDTLYTLRAWLSKISIADLEMVQAVVVDVPNLSMPRVEERARGVYLKGWFAPVECLKAEKKKKGSLKFDTISYRWQRKVKN